MISPPGGTPMGASCLVDREITLQSMAYFGFFLGFRRMARAGKTGASPENIVIARQFARCYCAGKGLRPLPDSDGRGMSPQPTQGVGEVSGGDSAVGRKVCRYLDMVSKLERLAGFDRRAAFFATAAIECPPQGCRFPSLCRAPDRMPRNPAAQGVTAVAFSPPPAGRRPAWGGAEPVAFTRAAAIDMIADDHRHRVERG